jgi:hypothetical protein
MLRLLARAVAIAVLLSPWVALLAVPLTEFGSVAGIPVADVVRTAGAVVVASVCATVLGAPLGRFLVGPPRKGLVFVHGAVALLVLAPLALHPASWAGLLGRAFSIGPLPAPGGGDLLAIAALTGTWAIAYAPLAGLLLAASARSVPDAAHVAERVLLPARVRWRVLVLPRLGKAMGLVSLAVAVLALQDGVTPPLLGVETVASRLLATWETTLDPVSPVAASASSWIGAVVLGAWVVARWERPETAERPARAVPPDGWSWGVAAGYATVATVIPLYGAGTYIAAGSSLVPWFLARREELQTTAWLVAASALSAAVVAAAWAFDQGVLSGRPRRRRRRVSRWLSRWFWTVALVTPLATPPLVLGLAWRPDLEWTSTIPESAMFLGRIALRAVPWALLLVVVLAPSPGRATAGLGLGDVARGRRHVAATAGFLLWAAAAAVPFALREVELFAVCAPPGLTSGAARMAQLLHYGVGDEAARWIQGQFMIGVAWAAGVVALRRRLS